MIWKREKINGSMDKYTSGEYVLVPVNGHSMWQLRREGWFLSHHKSLIGAKEYALQHSKVN